MKLREITESTVVTENPLTAVKTGAQKAAGAVKSAAGKVAQKGADMAVGAVAGATGASKGDVKAAAQQQGGVAGKVAGMASGDDKQAAAKTAQGSKMAANAMGAKGGSGAMMAKGLDKLASGGAMTGALSKQIAPFAKQLTTILGNQQLRQKFMMLVKQAEKGATEDVEVDEKSKGLYYYVNKNKKSGKKPRKKGEEGAPTKQDWDNAAKTAKEDISKDKDDYQAKKKALQDIQTDPNTHKDDELKKELMKRKYELDKEGKEKGYKEDAEVDAIKQLAGIVSKAVTPQTAYSEELKKLAGINEFATAGATSAGNIASVANPAQAKGHRPTDSKGLPKAPQKKKADGTAENALDIKDNLMGGATVKR